MAQLTDAEVKQFAEKMVEAHQKMLRELEKFGAQPITFLAAGQRRDAAQQEPNATNTENAGRVNRNDVSERGAATENGQRIDGARSDENAGRSMEFVSIKQEIAQECLRSSQEELASKKGPEADRCFMTAQVLGHQHMLDCLTVLERHASPEFAQLLNTASQTTKAHLEEAKQIAKKLDSGTAAPRSGKESGSTSGEPQNR
jgi:predicted outer membrane protein